MSTSKKPPARSDQGVKVTGDQRIAALKPKASANEGKKPKMSQSLKGQSVHRRLNGK